MWISVELRWIANLLQHSVWIRVCQLGISRLLFFPFTFMFLLQPFLWQFECGIDVMTSCEGSRNCRGFRRFCSRMYFEVFKAPRPDEDKHLPQHDALTPMIHRGRGALLLMCCVVYCADTAINFTVLGSVWLQPGLDVFYLRKRLCLATLLHSPDRRRIDCHM